MKYNHNKKAVFKLMFHIVLCTKYRRKVITKKILLQIKEIMNSIFVKNGITIVEFEGEEEHIHMLLDCPPTINLIKIINVIKTVSSREIRKKNNFGKLFLNKKAFWSPSYFVATCGGVTLEILKQYIDNYGVRLSPTIQSDGGGLRLEE